MVVLLAVVQPSLRSRRRNIDHVVEARPVNRSYRIGCPGWSDLRLVLTGHS